VALSCLQRIEREGAYANILTPAALSSSTLDERDRRFVTELVYGTTRMRRACDALIDRFVIREPAPAVRSLLRLGAFQLVFAGVPPHAAVDETVSLAPKQARGFVNAVLRGVARSEMSFASDGERLSYPDWIVHRFVNEFGADDGLQALAAMNEPAAVTERADGYVQDLGSQWVAAAVPARVGQVVVDVCAAPGGKSTMLAASGALVCAADRRESRVGLMAGNIRSLGYGNVVPLVADALAAPLRDRSADHVLLDAPCTGLGTLRRRPDARWRVQPDDVSKLAAVQQTMLQAAAQLVRLGGTLVYSVCSPLAQESSDRRVPDGFQPMSDVPQGTWRRRGDGWFALAHDAGTDAMSLVRWQRVSF
jgi:16S rRNA (cytosine967-C5)-methyltransferase